MPAAAAEALAPPMNGGKKDGTYFPLDFFVDAPAHTRFCDKTTIPHLHACTSVFQPQRPKPHSTDSSVAPLAVSAPLPTPSFIRHFLRQEMEDAPPAQNNIRNGPLNLSPDLASPEPVNQSSISIPFYPFKITVGGHKANIPIHDRSLEGGARLLPEVPTSPRYDGDARTPEFCPPQM